jgi:hypothetical protein
MNFRSDSSPPLRRTSIWRSLCPRKLGNRLSASILRVHRIGSSSVMRILTALLRTNIAARRALGFRRCGCHWPVGEYRARSPIVRTGQKPGFLQRSTWATKSGGMVDASARQQEQRGVAIPGWCLKLDLTGIDAVTGLVLQCGRGTVQR